MKDSPIGGQFIEHSDNFRRKLADRDVLNEVLYMESGIKGL